MNLKQANIVVILVILFGMTSHAYAQKRRSSYNPKAWYIGAEGGANIYFGDLKYWDYIPNIEYGELTYGGGVLFGKQLSPKFLLKGNIHYSKLSGTKRTPSLLRTFQTTEQDAFLSIQMNLFQTFSSRPRLERLSLWGEIGIGAIRWQSILYNTRTNDTLANLHWKTNDYEQAFMIPLGLNIKYYLSKNISLDAYSGLRLVNSDLLDAKPGGIKFDYYWYSGLALNYHFGFNNNKKSTINTSKHKAGDLVLIDYFDIDPFKNLEIKKEPKNENSQKEEENKSLENETISNPYRIEFWVPQKANNKHFQILLSIKKMGITGNGFFRLSLPSGFYPKPINIKEVSYTRIAYNYDYDFYLPMNKDTLLIPIEIIISERENGTYPLFIEGEIINQDGELFKIKSAQYVQIDDGIDYNNIPDNIPNETLVPKYENPKNVSPEIIEASGDKTFRIQILACRKPSVRVDNFLKQHEINQDVFLYQAEGWWRYSIYHLSTIEKAEEYLQTVRNKHHITEAFIVEFNNGKRTIPGGNQSVITHNTNQNTIQYQENQMSIHRKINNKSRIQTKDKQLKTSESVLEKFQPVLDDKNISVYRIEIAVSPSYPIPLRQLQNWVANERITEWTYKNNYRYTIGRFENEQVARAFLKYVRLQFALPDAHMVETKGKTWQRVVR